MILEHIRASFDRYNVQHFLFYTALIARYMFLFQIVSE